VGVATDSGSSRLFLVISGRVQGVGFRYSAQRQANSLGIHGWVRNRSDGSVEAVIEGSHDAVRSFVSWARAGPSGASVDWIETSEEALHGEAGFRILP
jgi:acylphosphatase